jgi:hypothetical protein
MEINSFYNLHKDGILSDASFNKIKNSASNKLFSLHWELKTILYLGILLLSGGLSILIYKNIDTIGHQAILLFIAVVFIGCFFYCYTHKLPFSTTRVSSPNTFFDYILLLGCLTFITFIGYLQFQYHLFGFKYGLATFIPMLVLFFTAYYFDNIAILSMAITALAAWAGIAVTPLTILRNNDFNSDTIIFTEFFLGIALMLLGYFSCNKLIKKHFEFTYSNFGTHLLFISILAAIFHFDNLYLLFFLLLAMVSFLYYLKAVKEKSFYYLLVFSLYFYIGLSYTLITLLFSDEGLNIGGVYLAFIYFILSAIFLIVFLIKMNRQLKSL